MRQKNREITDNNKINEIILSCSCCRLGFNDNGKVYIVPLNFGYVEQNKKRIFYFHSAKEGRKIDLISKKMSAGFELDTNYKLNEATTACGYSSRFQSIIGLGIVVFVSDFEEKEQHCKK